MKFFAIFTILLIAFASMVPSLVEAGDKGDTIIIGTHGHKKHHECHCGHDWGHGGFDWGGMGIFRRRR